jgi:cytochrome c peroxidase
MQIRNIILYSFLFLGLSFLVSSCIKDEGNTTSQTYTDADYEVISAKLTLPNSTIEYLDVDLPKHMQSSGFSIAGGNIENHGATLGRVLFYETRLSKNNAVSCSSCHAQANGFADPVAFSKGFDDQDTKRNSLALGNVRFYYHDRGFMWDERAESVEDQTRLTVTDHIEMGMDNWEEVVGKLRNEAFYDILFKKAFGSSEITETRLQKALSMFVRSIVSKGAKFDEAMISSDLSGLNSNTELSGYTDSENAGLKLYMNTCRTCHGNILFLGQSFANNGLDMDYTDKGIGALTNNSSQNGVFKVPFMRNIAMTAPYMHDGRFETLEEVVEHYSTGIKNHNNLDFKLPAGGLNFTETEKTNLLDFLHTLSDHEMAAEERYSNPFK